MTISKHCAIPHVNVDSDRYCKKKKLHALHHVFTESNNKMLHILTKTCDKIVTILKLEILRKCRSVKHGLDALRQEQSSILHSLVATLTAIRREKDPDTR